MSLKGDFGVKSTLKSNLRTAYYFKAFTLDGEKRGTLSLSHTNGWRGLHMCLEGHTRKLRHLSSIIWATHAVTHDPRPKTPLFGHKKHKDEPLTSCHVRLPHNNSPPTQSLGGTCHAQHYKCKVNSRYLQWSVLLVWVTICIYALAWFFF